MLFFTFSKTDIWFLKLKQNFFRKLIKLERFYNKKKLLNSRDLQLLSEKIRLYNIYSSCNKANNNTNLFILLDLSSFTNKYKNFF